MSSKIETERQWLCQDNFKGLYAKDFWLTKFTPLKSDAYNFACLWIFKYPFIWIMNEVHLDENLVWVKCIRNKGFNLQLPFSRKLTK